MYFIHCFLGNSLQETSKVSAGDKVWQWSHYLLRGSTLIFSDMLYSVTPLFSSMSISTPHIRMYIITVSMAMLLADWTASIYYEKRETTAFFSEQVEKSMLATKSYMFNKP